MAWRGAVWWWGRGVTCRYYSEAQKEKKEKDKLRQLCVALRGALPGKGWCVSRLSRTPEL